MPFFFYYHSDSVSRFCINGPLIASSRKKEQPSPLTLEGLPALRGNRQYRDTEDMIDVSPLRMRCHASSPRSVISVLPSREARLPTRDRKQPPRSSETDGYDSRVSVKRTIVREFRQCSRFGWKCKMQDQPARDPSR
ncbi:hypothetical protein V8C44DRAFT_344218 [Trichoderma aethiopicum]